MIAYVFLTAPLERKQEKGSNHYMFEMCEVLLDAKATELSLLSRCSCEADLGRLRSSLHSGFQPMSVTINDSTLAFWQLASILTSTQPAFILWWEERADGEMTPTQSLNNASFNSH